ncbi:MAG: L-threonine 3-dehydrogenase [Acidobacteriota bacterium]
MGKILVTGALGQIGSELTPALRASHGADNVVASDIRIGPGQPLDRNGPFEVVDCTRISQLSRVVRRHDVRTIYHLAALLSAVAEEKPHVAWDINMGGLYRVLEVARQARCAVFHPSSIGAFGPSTPRNRTPQDTIQRPTTMYGVTKVAGELLCDYYHHRFGVDTRGVRFPGLISHVQLPGGGTTDFAVEMFYAAIRHGSYTCFVRPDTRLDMMYMPDAVKASMDLMEADASRLVHRNAFNLTAMNFTAAELASAIREEMGTFEVTYDVDPVRQAIADTWPRCVDDSAARAEWDWRPSFDLPAMTKDMLTHLRDRIGRGAVPGRRDV